MICFSCSFPAFSPGWSTPGAHVHVRRPSINALALTFVGVRMGETIELYKYNQQSLAMDDTVKPRASLYQELEDLESLTFENENLETWNMEIWTSKIENLNFVKYIHVHKWLEMVVKRTFMPVANFGLQSLGQTQSILIYCTKNRAIFNPGVQKPFHLVRRFSYMDVMTKVRYFLTNEN